MLCLYNKTFDKDKYKDIEIKKKENNDLCVFCLEGNNISFYEYDDKELIHKCKCRPAIHKECFYHILIKNKKCIICNESIIKKLSKYDSFKINIRQSILIGYYRTFYLLLIYAFSRFVLFNFYIYFFFD